MSASATHVKNPATKGVSSFTPAEARRTRAECMGLDSKVAIVTGGHAASVKALPAGSSKRALRWPFSISMDPA